MYILNYSVCLIYTSVDARYNWWGSDDFDYIFSRIYDFYDDIKLVEADFSPTYTTASMTAVRYTVSFIYLYTCI